MKGISVAPTLYVESSIVSYLRSRPSGHVISAARQLVTQRWWVTERHNYQLLISQYVIDEISKGDPILAQERMTIVADIPVIGINDELSNLAETFLEATLLPPRARLDALHICAAVIGGVDYLLTWNCTHIANARTLPRVHDFFAQLGHSFPVVCTPEELLDDEYPIT